MLPRGSSFLKCYRIRVDLRTHLSTGADAFHFKVDLEAFEDDQQVAYKEWDVRIPRDYL